MDACLSDLWVVKPLSSTTMTAVHLTSPLRGRLSLLLRSPLPPLHLAVHTAVKPSFQHRLVPLSPHTKFYPDPFL